MVALVTLACCLCSVELGLEEALEKTQSLLDQRVYEVERRIQTAAAAVVGCSMTEAS